MEALGKQKGRGMSVKLVKGVSILALVTIIGTFFFVIFFGGGVELSESGNCGSDDNTGTTTANVKYNIKVKDSPNYLTRMKNISKAVGKKIGIKPRLLFSQLYAESGPDGSQPVNTKDNNYGGMTWTQGCGYPKGTTRGAGGSEGGWYRHYKNVSQFASDWAVTVKSNFSDLGNPTSLSDYLKKMKAKGYMATNDMAGYLSRMETGWSLWSGKSTLSGAVQQADSGSGDDGADCDTDGGVSGGSIVKEAKKWIGKLIYGASHTANAHWQHPSSSDTTDCSGFVWFVCKRVGVKVPPGNWTTSFMEEDARHKHVYLKQVSKENSRAGDFFVVNVGAGLDQNGHASILLSKYRGGSTKIVEMGGDRNYRHVNIRTISYAYGYMLPKGRMTIMRPISSPKNSSSGSGSSTIKGLSKKENAARLWIMQHESGGNYKAVNRTNPDVYGAYQLMRAYLAKGSDLGGDGTLSKKNQDHVAVKYAKQRYGSFQNAKKFWQQHHWW